MLVTIIYFVWRNYLHERGIATSTSTPYHPTGNSQCERANQTIWKTIKLFLATQELPDKEWEFVLPDALHAIRSLLCTATNCTPHERFLPSFPRRSTLGKSLPSWLCSPGTAVFYRNHLRRKHDPAVQEVELIEANPRFSTILFSDGRQATVSTSDLALLENEVLTDSQDLFVDENHDSLQNMQHSPQNMQLVETINNNLIENSSGITDTTAEPTILRRSNRVRKPPERFGDWEYS